MKVGRGKRNKNQPGTITHWESERIHFLSDVCRSGCPQVLLTRIRYSPALRLAADPAWDDIPMAPLCWTLDPE